MIQKLNMSFNNKLKYLYTALAAIPLAIAAIGFVVLQNFPYTGLHFEHRNDRWYIASVDKGSPAAAYPELSGKEIISITGQQIKKHDLAKEFDDIPTRHELANYWDTHTYFAQNIKPSVPLRITVSDGKTETSLYLTPSYLSAWIIFTKSSVIFLQVLIFIGLGILILFKKPNDFTTKLFFLAMVLTSTIASSLGVLHASDIVIDSHLLQLTYIIHALANISATAVITHFLMIFPRDIYLHKHKWILRTLYVAAVIVFFVYLFRLIPGIHYMFVLFCMTVTIIFLIANYSQFNSVERSQVKWFYLGFSLFMFIDMFVYILPPLFIGYRLIDEGKMLIVGLLFPLSMVFAIMKYRLMDIDTLFDNTIIYTTTLALLVALDIAVITILVNFKILQLYSTLTLITSVWIIIFTYIPVRNFMQKHIKKIFHREIYEINTVLLDLSKNFISATDIRSAFTQAHQAIDAALHPKGIDTYIADQHGYIATRPGWTDAQTLQTLTSPTHLYLINPPDNNNSTPLPNNYAGGICVPLIGMERTWGYIVLQDKYSGRLYDKDDIKLLSLISGQLAMTIEALQYKETIRIKEEESREKDMRTAKEKEMVIKDIHDGIGGTLTNINLLGYMGGQKTSEPEIKTFFNTISELAKESIFEIHNLYAILEGKNADWAMIISGIKQFGESMLTPHGIELSFRYHIEDNTPDSISSQMFINLYKIYKEAISNIVKYSKADRANVMLDIKKNIMTFSIRDNGIGLTDGNTNGRGLKHMRERVGEIGGDIEITSENGVNIMIKLPFNGE